MTVSLVQLRRELLESIEQRDAGDPDAPAWEATARIQRLEAELARLSATVVDGLSDGAEPASFARSPDEAFVGVA